MKLNEFLNYIPKKKSYILFGKDLSYSISKDIHTLIFKYHKLDFEYIYVEIEENELKLAFNHMKKYFAGANITIPYKCNVIELLDFVDSDAKRLNSVNTIKVQGGKTLGYNTDILGIKSTFFSDEINLKNKKVALLGSGATANVLCDVLCENEADITIFSRNEVASTEVCKTLNKSYHNAKVSTNNLENFQDNFDIICNATPVGMSSLIDQSPVKSVKTSNYIFDVIYNPYYTKLLEYGKKNGSKTRNGLHMLLVQAYEAQRIWNFVELKYIKEISSKLELILAKKRIDGRNIVLMGFMGAGKTHTAKLLSKSLDCQMIDTDNLIEINENMKTSKIFQEKGEKYFRSLEHNLTLDICNHRNTIISLGGGFPINNPNIDKLKESSIFIFLDTELEVIKKRITNDKTRPLSNKIDTLFEERYEKYKDLCDIYIKTSLIESEMEILRRI